MPKIDLIEALKSNPFVLAPMAGITDNAFRSFMKEMHSGAVITELISANGLEYGSRRTKQLMDFEEGQRPVGIQFFGEHPEFVARAAQEAERMGADFVDLNFGCPVPKVVNKGAGSAILKDLDAVQTMFRTVKAAIQIPLTVKIRTGWTYSTRNAAVVAQIAYDEGLTWVAIHGRDRAQGYAGQADWDYIGEVKAKVKIPILGNGDILTAQRANERLRDYKLDGVMIGRGCLKNPWIFLESHLIYQGIETPVQKDYMQVFERLKYHLQRTSDERMQQLQLKKFASWFSAGYPNAANFRKALFQTKEMSHLMEEVNRFYDSIKNLTQEDTSKDGFLMGGHG